MSKQMSLIGLIGLLLGLIFLAAWGLKPAGDAGEPLPAAVQNARAWLAEQLGVAPGELSLVRMEEVEWTDSCYGLGGPAEICAAVMTPGWEIVFEIHGDEYEVRSDQTGTFPRSPQIQ